MPSGVYVRTEENKRNLSKAHLGKRCGEDNNMYGIHRYGKDSPSWKGGISSDGTGYIRIYKPEHLYSNKRGYVYQHRLVMEEFLGRYLLPEEQIHHINGIRTDNGIENLMLFATCGEHTKYHAKFMEVTDEVN